MIVNLPNATSSHYATKDEVAASEVRIRREVRALAFPIAAFALLAASYLTDEATTGIVWAAFGVLILGMWFVRRPELLGDEAQQTFRQAKQHKALALLTVVGGIGIGLGVPTAVYDPNRWWAWTLLTVGVAASVVLGCLLVIGRRNYERAKETA